jgi:hypothetical protein
LAHIIQADDHLACKGQKATYTRTVAVLLRHHSGSKLVFVDPASKQLIRDAVRSLPPEHPEFEWVRPISEWHPRVLNTTPPARRRRPRTWCTATAACIFLVTVDSVVEWAVSRFLWTLPIFHGNGCGATRGGWPWSAASTCASTAIYGSVARHGVTHLCGAPVVLTMLANSPEPFPGKKKKKVRILTAGMAVSCTWKPEWDALPLSERALLRGCARPRWTPAPAAAYGSTAGEVVLRGACVMLGSATSTTPRCRDRVPNYMVPKAVAFRAGLLRLSTGKVQKYVLRELARDMGLAGKKNSSKM